jgi:hypothetical protein
MLGCEACQKLREGPKRLDSNCDYHREAMRELCRDAIQQGVRTFVLRDRQINIRVGVNGYRGHLVRWENRAGGTGKGEPSLGDSI